MSETRDESEDTTVLVGRGVVVERSAGASEQSILYADARRLLEFKRQNVNRQDQIPCPECAFLVSVQAKKCGHCGSAIEEHTESAREALEELDRVMAELAELHKRELERHLEAARATPLRERVGRLLADATLRQDLQVLAPGALVLFGTLALLRVSAKGVVFWPCILLAVWLVPVLLRRAGIQRLVTLNLYRLVLVIGLGIAAASAVFRPMPFWPDALAARVEVVSPSANLRAEPTKESDVVARAQSGDSLEVTDREGEWFEVRTEAGKSGWVHSALVR